MSNLELPCTMDLFRWSPNIIFNSNFDYAHYHRGDLVYMFELNTHSYTCNIANSSGRVLLSFKDTRLSSTSDFDSFTRTFKDTSLSYIGGILVSSESKLDNKFIRKLHRNESLSNKFITLDLETQGMITVNPKTGLSTTLQSLVSISIYGGGPAHPGHIKGSNS